jgi:hypothetical protein
MAAFYTSPILRVIALRGAIAAFTTAPNKDFCAVISGNPSMRTALITARDKRLVIAKHVGSAFRTTPISHIKPLLHYHHQLL